MTTARWPSKNQEVLRTLEGSLVIFTVKGLKGVIRITVSFRAVFLLKVWPHPARFVSRMAFASALSPHHEHLLLLPIALGEARASRWCHLVPWITQQPLLHFEADVALDFFLGGGGVIARVPVSIIQETRTGTPKSTWCVVILPDAKKCPFL